jgi:hypothetical protein
MKRIAAFLLLLSLTPPAWSLPTRPENTRIGENGREARKAAKQHKKAVNQLARKQRRAMKKYQKSQRKLARNSQRRYR